MKGIQKDADEPRHKRTEFCTADRNRARVRRYRSHHRRIDYIPRLDVWTIINHPLKIVTDPYLAGACIRTQGGGAR